MSLLLSVERGPPLALPSGPSWLRLPVDEAEAPALGADASAEAPPRVALEVLTPRSTGAARDSLLLAAFPQRLHARLNGEPAPLLAWLRPGDRLEVPGGPVLHVLLRLVPELGPPPPAAIGLACAVCRTPVAADSRVYVCRCGACLHAEGEGRPATERLECALLSSACPACQEPVRFEEVTLGHADD